jgi:hypothetical protein
MSAPDRYRIVRFFKSDRPAQRRGLPKNLTLDEARAHCSDLNTSSSTSWKTSAIERTRRYGAWFDGFEVQS